MTHCPSLWGITKLLFVAGIATGFLFLAIPSSAGTIYVDGAVDDPGDGSPENPYPSLTMAVVVACLGDTIIVQSGSYSENVVINTPVTITAAGGSALVGSSSANVAYTSYPLITDSAITDIHEGLGTGPEGYAYFTAAPDKCVLVMGALFCNPGEKTGTLPACLGGETGWDTDVWASNFQGPIPVSGKSARMQWEWTADGSLQTSQRPPYPFIYGQVTTTQLNYLTSATYDIFEDDECFIFCNPDDDVGSITIDHSACRSEVFDRGLLSGWTSEHESSGGGDVEYVRYRLYCFRSL